MIINFEQNAETYFEFARAAEEEGDYITGLKYVKKALAEKRTPKFLVELAYIYLYLGRLNAAADVCFEVLATGRTGRSEVYEILSKVTGIMGWFYESMDYLAKKAREDGNDDAIDAVNDLMENMLDDYITEATEKAGKPKLFIVGKEKSGQDDEDALKKAIFYYERGEYKKAEQLLCTIRKDSAVYPHALSLLLDCVMDGGDKCRVYEVAKELIASDKYNAKALYALIVVAKQHEYVDALEGVKNDTASLQYAITAAETVGRGDIATKLAKRLVAEDAASPGANFVLAATLYNSGDKTACKKVLADFFNAYDGVYPDKVILASIGKQKRLDLALNTDMPAFAVKAITAFVKRSCRNAETLCREFYTSEQFRRALAVLFEYGNTDFCIKLVRLMVAADDKSLWKFLQTALMKSNVYVALKGEIVFEHFRHFEKGRFGLVTDYVLHKVPLAKPDWYYDAPQPFREAVCRALAFTCAFLDAEHIKQVYNCASTALHCKELSGLSPEMTAAVIGYAVMPQALDFPLTQQKFGSYFLQGASVAAQFCGISKPNSVAKKICKYALLLKEPR